MSEGRVRDANLPAQLRGHRLSGSRRECGDGDNAHMADLVPGFARTLKERAALDIGAL